VELIAKLPPPTNIKGLRSFLGHVGFYRQFVKEFSKMAKPLSNLLIKDTKFHFDEEYEEAFAMLKHKLSSTPIITTTNWNLNFEMMCDASDYVVGAVLGQKKDKQFHVINYATKVLKEAQRNYATTKKELLAIIFGL